MKNWIEKQKELPFNLPARQVDEIFGDLKESYFSGWDLAAAESGRKSPCVGIRFGMGAVLGL